MGDGKILDKSIEHGQANASITREPIAIVGMACRLPGAPNPNAFWDLICNGERAIGPVPADRWELDEDAPKGTTQGGFLDSIDGCDWRSLRMLPREARHMDPQHRLLLELAWEALEDAGLPMEDVAGSRTGVFVGIQWSDFFSQLSRDWSKIDGYAMVGNPSMFAANRISYTFDLRGPSIAMDTGCTSSFSSLQSACESLWLGDCDRVLVGASEIILSPSVQMGMDRAGLLSRSGSSMPFDQSADGFLRGEGGGMLVLKRVSDLLPHERAYAQIAGVATRHAGANDWIMATSARAQSEAVTAACAQCDVDPSKLDYVELHAAGSPRGDPVEVEVLSNVIAGPDRAETPCLLGSVKANIGHLGPASGVAGLIKVAMGLHKNTLPRTIAPKTLISEIASETSGLALSETPQPWLGDTRSGLAGVTSLSLGGTSAHVVLRANDQSAAPSSDSQDTPYILALSAPSQDALDDTVQAYIDYLRSEQADRIENICFTAAIGRSHHEVRVAVTGRTTAELADALAASSNDASLDPLDAIAAQYMAGEPIDWSEISFGNGTITSLPLYAWQRQRMWPEWLDATCMGTPPQMQVAPVAAPKDTAPQPRILPPLDQVRLRTSEVLELAQDEIDAAKMLTEIGLDSLTASELSRRLSADFQIDIPIVELLRQPSISAIADMLETRLAQRSDTSPAYETSTLPQISFDRAALHEPFPLTDIQTAYWIGRTARDALGGVGCHYYQEFECDSLDFKRLEQSFQALIVRHDMLRAVVTSEGMQQILDNTPTYEIAQLDLRGEDSAETENGLESVRREMATTRFDPEVWPLFEVRATHQDDNRMRVHLSFDLITVDATSLSLLIREWETLYKDPSALKPLDISFRDYVLAEIAHKDTQDFKSDAAYWDARLDDIAPAPILPAEVPNSQTAATGEALARIRRKGYLSPKAWSNLRARAGARGLTPSSVLCSAFSEILGTWGGGDRFTLNLTYCSRRPVHPRMSEMIGDFTTTILLDVDRTPQTFAEKAAILQARLGADMDHAAVSGVEVLRRVRQSRPEDGLAVMPVVFTSLLGHGAVSGETLFSSNWLGDLIYGISQTPQVSLDHQAFEENGSLVLHWDAVEDLFPAGVLDDMFTAYIEMLEALAEPEAWDNALLEHVPARQLARNAAVNATEAEFPTGLLHAPFEQRAKDQPDALAVIDGDTRLTYGDLDQRSLALAHKIREADVAPHAPVAIVMKKGWAQIVAALAILRAGAAYVPIDAALPNARISYLLDNCDITVALSQSDVELPSTEAAEDKSILNLVVDTQPMPSSDMPPLDCGASLDGLAYTIFTSGSTGQPKGVMIAHGAARNTIEDINARFNVGPQDRVLALSSLSFDLSVYDVFGVLGAGGALVIPPAGSERDPQTWANLMQSEGVTLWNSVPALMTLLTEFCTGRSDLNLDALRLVMLSGDWIPTDAFEAIKRIAPNAKPFGLGGATEASIWSIINPIEKLAPGSASVPYGKPMANQTMHVLDQQFRERPEMVVGELFIGGVGVAMGYWRNPSETEYRFVAQPQTGERLYRTGDLGRMLPDGTIELLGRADLQVKIQGHRIELGEIETALRLHTSIDDAVVVTVKDSAGRQRLVAAAVAKEQGTISDADLQSWLSEHLPAYMVPETITLLPALPLTANGKVDRGQIAKIATPKPNTNARPKGELEQALADVVAQVLGRDRVGVEDSFLSLGCTSIDFVRIHRGMNGFMEREVPVVEMFSHSNIRSLASALSGRTRDDTANRAQKRRTRLQNIRKRA